MKTKKLTSGALFAAITFILTVIIKIPSLFKGYINPGDVGVILSGLFLSPGMSFFAAGLGSALADLFYGYVTYIPATFIIKGLMAVSVYYVYKSLSKKLKGILPLIISAVISEGIMIAGYFLFEGMLYGFIPSMANILPNAIQGGFAIIVTPILLRIIKQKP